MAIRGAYSKILSLNFLFFHTIDELSLNLFQSENEDGQTYLPDGHQLLLNHKSWAGAATTLICFAEIIPLIYPRPSPAICSDVDFVIFNLIKLTCESSVSSWSANKSHSVADYSPAGCKVLKIRWVMA